MTFSTSGKIYLTVTIIMCIIVLPLIGFFWGSKHNCPLNYVIGMFYIGLFLSIGIGAALYYTNILTILDCDSCTGLQSGTPTIS
jgi:RsiW-degrading membrane proteinase PrsW (M82 family)